MDRPHALIAGVLVACAPASERTAAHPGTLATGVVSATGATGEGFHDATRAVNGVRGAGAQAGSTDVFSIPPDGELVLSFDEPIPDGEGPDLAVFENPFDVDGGGRFMDPAVVEASDDCEGFVAFPFEGPEAWSADPSDWSGFAGITPVLLHEEEHPVDPFGEEAGGDVFDLGDVGLDEVVCVRVTAATAWGFPADPISDGPDVDGVYGR